MSDSAEGPISGFLYQFQKALLSLASLRLSDQSISIENVDDISEHDGGDGNKVLYTYQVKHSLSQTGSDFGNSSKALWRTLEIWLDKLSSGILDDDTIFVCSTNRPADPDSLLVKIKNLPFKEVISEIELIRSRLKTEGDEKKAKGETSPHIDYILKRITKALADRTNLMKIFGNLRIDVEEDIKSRFLSLMRMDYGGVSSARQNLVYDACYGWLISSCYAKWRNGKVAVLSKRQFDSKWAVLNTNPHFVNAIFRKKKELGTLTDDKRLELNDELFVRQINDIDRGPGKKLILEKAMLDFLHHKIEMSFVIEKGDFTDVDFSEFENQCKEIWEEHFLSNVIKEEHSEAECNAIAIRIYDNVMKEDRLLFNDGFRFDTSNHYIRKGSFLKLSNAPEIGWRPDWEFKYKSHG